MKKNSTVQDIRQAIQTKRFAPVYLLDGEETFYIDELMNQFENEVIPDEEKDFNFITLYGRENSWQEVVNAARRYPMFGEKLLVLVKDAFYMKDLAELTAYIENPMSSTILVIEHRFKKIDGRSKLLKAVYANGVYFHSEKIKDYHITQWIVDYGRSKNIQIGNKEAELLSIYLGNDLQKIANEIEKVLINEQGAREINLDLIAQYIGISKEYNILEYPDALFEGSSEHLTRMLNYFIANPKSAAMPAIVGIFYSYLNKVYLSYHTKEHFQEDRKLGIWTKHRKIAQRFPETTIHKCFAVLEEFSTKAVGIDNFNNDGSLIKEMSVKIRIVLSS